MGPLDATFGSGRVGAHDVDTELVQSASVLRHAGAAKAGALVVMEHRVLVAVERDSLAIPLKIKLGGLHVVKRRLAFDAQQKLQSASGVVHIGQECTWRSALFEPTMLRPIDLNELALVLRIMYIMFNCIIEAR